MKKRMIYLMRHAETELFDKKIYLGVRDVDTSERGIGICQKKADFFRNCNIKSVYSSSLKRCVNTACIITEVIETKVMIVNELREIDLGDWELKEKDYIIKHHYDEYVKRGDNIMEFKTPGGESFNEMRYRVEEAFRRIVDSSTGNIIIVAHSGVNRIILKEIMDDSEIDMFSIKQDYCCINEIFQEGEKLIVGRINI